MQIPYYIPISKDQYNVVAAFSNTVMNQSAIYDVHIYIVWMLPLEEEDIDNLLDG